MVNGTNQDLGFAGTRLRQLEVSRVSSSEDCSWVCCMDVRAVVMSFKIALWSGERGYKFSTGIDDKSPTSPFTMQMLLR